MTVHARLTLLLTLCCSSAHAFDPAWQAVELLTFDTSTVGTDQSDVTIPIVLNASRINYSLAGPNGEQIRFVDDDDATVLDHEIESWDPAGTSVLWVRVPIVDGGSTSDHIYLYYDNPAATDVQNPAGAYDGSTELVFHFENNPPTDSLTGVASSNTGSTRVTGALGQGRQFDGINDYFSPSGTLSSLLQGTASMEFLVNTSDLGSNSATTAPAIAGHRKNSATSELHAWGFLNDQGAMGIRVGNDELQGGTPINDGTWHHVIVQRASGTGELEVYIDGSLDGSMSGATGTIVPDTNFSDVGRIIHGGAFSTSYFDGTIDEFRVRSATYSAARARLQSLALNDQLIDWCIAVVWYADTDGDGFGDPTAPTALACSQPAGFVLNDSDCDDSAPNINPNGQEVCDVNDNDEDCDGLTDNADPSVTNTSTFYIDNDGDGFGDPTNATQACDPTALLVSDNQDCDDTDPSINPDTVWYRDADGDGHGNASTTQASCLQPAGYVALGDDCDDTDPLAWDASATWYLDSDRDGYGAGTGTSQCQPPTPNHVSNNLDCDDTDATLNPDTIWYHDQDNDQFGDPLDSVNQCNSPPNHVLDGTDCDDSDNSIYPGAPETCNGEDDDCDGLVDVGAGTGPTWYADLDSDQYGDPYNTTQDCVAPPGYVADNSDCDDTDPNIRPGAFDLCGDGLDADCDDQGGPLGDEDGDGISFLDETAVGASDCSPDSDADGVPDSVEYPLGDTDGDGDDNIIDVDDDGDLIATQLEGTDDTDAQCGAADGIPNYLDLDSDGDGIDDIVEGSGDADLDGIPDFLDCVNDDGLDGDQDGDGLTNGTELDLGTDGASADSDGDGVDDLTEVGGLAGAPQEIDTDGDGLIDAVDPDDDGDGLPTIDEDADTPGDPLGTDTDDDGTPDYLDDDDDNDGVPTLLENLDGDFEWFDEDTDGDGIANHLDDDDDGDGTPTLLEDRNGNGDWFDDDADLDGVIDFLDADDSDGAGADADGDGLTNGEEAALGTDPMQSDSDGDGLSDLAEGTGDSDGDGIIDPLDEDDDGDGVPTSEETSGDTDGDGIPNHLDTDSDGDGTPDSEEFGQDLDCDGVDDWADNRDDGTCDEAAGNDVFVEHTGCACAGPTPVSWLAWLVAPLAFIRRRR